MLYRTIIDTTTAAINTVNTVYQEISGIFACTNNLKNHFSPAHAFTPFHDAISLYCTGATKKGETAVGGRNFKITSLPFACFTAVYVCFVCRLATKRRCAGGRGKERA